MRTISVEKNKATQFSWIAVSFKSPKELWEEHWYGLVLEVSLAIILCQILRQAKRRGNDYFYMTVAAAFAPIGLELLPIIPNAGYQLWWYHQGLVNIINQRLPSYAISLFVIVYYLAHSATERSNLPPITRSLVLATVATLLYIPFLWLSPKLLFTSLHFDDDVFKNKLFGIPDQQIIVIFLMFFHVSHLFSENKSALQVLDTYNYTWVAVQTGIVTSIYTIVEQYLLYLLLTLILHLNPVFCMVAVLGVLIALAAQEMKPMEYKSYSLAGKFQPLKSKLFWSLLFTMIYVSALPLWVNPETLKSNSDWLELGPCQTVQQVANTSPLDTERRRYVCPDDTKLLDFDFHCVDEATLAAGVKKLAKRYTICGKPWNNSIQISSAIAMYAAICMVVFYNVMRLTVHFNFPASNKKASS